MNHSPAPWKIDKTGQWSIVAADGFMVLALPCDSESDAQSDLAELEDQDRANAPLIAAAPELLAHLQEWADCCGDCPGPDPDPKCDICGPARALIARAMGRT